MFEHRLIVLSFLKFSGSEKTALKVHNVQNQRDSVWQGGYCVAKLCAKSEDKSRFYRGRS